MKVRLSDLNVPDEGYENLSGHAQSEYKESGK